PVVARDADERRAPAERHDVRRGVGGATRHRAPAAEADDRYRRFGRDPRRVAVEVLVQHEVADDEDGLVRKTDEQIGELKRHVRWILRYGGGAVRKGSDTVSDPSS